MKTKKLNYIWLGPIITVAIMLVLYAIAGIYPFGSNTTAFSDGINQYVPMLAELTRKLKEGGSLFFTWNMGRGTNFWSHIIYYLASPFNLIALFFKNQNMDDAFSVITLLKPAVMSLTFGIYLKYAYKKNDISVAIFSVLWAFSGFVFACIFITSWMDAIIYFPLVILGLKRMMDGESAWLYSLFLGLSILSNFYIGWMICIFCIIYFIYSFIADDEVVYEGVTSDSIEEKNDDEGTINIFAVFKNSYLLNSMFRFGTASILGGLVSTIMTLPVIFALANTAKGTVKHAIFNPGEIWGIIAGHIVPIKNTYASMTSMNYIYCFSGIITLLLVIAYFFNKDIPNRKKLGNLFLLAVMWCSIAFHDVYYVWHGFGEPAGFMYRFAFIYSFVLLKIAFECYEKIVSANVCGIVFGIAFSSICVYSIYKTQLILLFSSYQLLSIIIVSFVILYSIILLLISHKEKYKSIMSVVLLIAITFEIISLNYNNMNSFDMTSSYLPESIIRDLNFDKDDYEVLSFENANENFYEMNTYGLLYGYSSGEIYSSMADENFVLTTAELGAYSNRMNSENGAIETTPIFNVVFPTRYTIDGTGRLQENWFHTKVAEKDSYVLYENNYTMPFMFLTSGNIGKWAPFSFPVVVDDLNEVFKQITDTKDNVAIYNDNANFVLENCTSISSVDKVKDQREESGEEYGGETDKNNESFWNYLDSKMTSYSYTITDVTKPAYITFDTVAKTDGIMYIFVDTTEFTDMTITINGKTTQYYTYGDGENRTYELGKVKKGDVATVKIGGYKEGADDDGIIYIQKTSSIAALAFTVDENVFKSGYDKLDKMSDTEMLEFSDTHVKAKVTAYEDGALYIPMAFDKGWKITVDGVPTEIYEHQSHIMMFGMAKGEHIVEMKYCPQGFVAGAVITGISLVILVAWAVISKKRSDKVAVCDTIEENAKEE